MAVAGFFFYLFSAITVAAAFMVIAARNPDGTLEEDGY